MTPRKALRYHSYVFLLVKIYIKVNKIINRYEWNWDYMSRSIWSLDQPWIKLETNDIHLPWWKMIIDMLESHWTNHLWMPCQDPPPPYYESSSDFYRPLESKPDIIVSILDSAIIEARKTNVPTTPDHYFLFDLERDFAR